MNLGISQSNSYRDSKPNASPSRHAQIKREDLALRLSNLGQRTSTVDRERMFDKRVEELKKEFADIDRDHNGKISEEEMLYFLDKKCGKEFDRNIGNNIFKNLDKDRDGNITTDEFISTYLEAEDFLKNKLNEDIRRMADHKRQREDMATKLTEAKATERVNSYGIMENSILTINVIEARDLKPLDLDGKSDPYVILSIENQKIETKYIPGTLNPVWNESFTFDIETGSENIKIIVMDKDMFAADDFEGECILPLALLRDQMKHDMWFDLRGKNPKEKWQGKIRLNLQWIHSRVTFLADVVNRWDETIKADMMEKEQTEQHLAKLREPFGYMQFAEQSIKSPGNVISLSALGGVSQAVQQVLANETMHVFSKRVDTFARNMGYENIPWYRFTLYALLLYIIMTIICMFYRPDFLNLTIAIVAHYVITNEKYMNKKSFQYIFLTVLGSILYDIVWLFIFTSSWNREMITDGGVERRVRRFSLAISYISLFFRIIIAFFFWKDSVDYEKVIQNQQGLLPSHREQQHPKIEIMANLGRRQAPQDNPFEDRPY